MTTQDGNASDDSGISAPQKLEFLTWKLGLAAFTDKENGLTNGGWWTPDELAGIAFHYDGSYALKPLLGNLSSHTDFEGRSHELIHCFDVGLGAAALMEQIAADPKAQQQLGVTEVTLDAIRAAFYSGVFHDMVLSFRGDALTQATPERTILSRVDPSTVSVFQGKAQYIKDAVEDDLRGAILLDAHGKNLPSGVRERAVAELLNGSALPVQGTHPRLLGQFSPYKILDAIWYHDGNNPIRGHAEADAIIGDRITLYEKPRFTWSSEPIVPPRVPIEVVGAGIDKLLGYTAPDPAWETRQTATDVPFLQNIIEKKAGGNFLETVRGTPIYDFVVEDLARRGRAGRTLNSPAFWRGVDKMPLVLHRVEEHAELRAQFGPKLEELHRRYDAVQQYRPR